MPRQSSKESKHFNDDRSLKEYSKAWYEKVVQIWLDRYSDFEIGIHPTQKSSGDLRKSITPAGYKADALETEMRFKFLQYGIYVDAGTGKGYKRGNGGDLKFLGKDYRKEHKLGKAREPRPWFSKSWYVSTQVIRDVYARLVGEKFVGIMDNLD